MFEDIRSIAVSVTSSIFETMFFTFIEPQSGEGEEEQSGFESSPVFLRGEIGFAGKYSGKLRLYLPVEMAQMMASSFMGLEEEKASESQASDMVNELCNMICGNLCSQLDKKTVWDLTIPNTQPVPRQEIHHDPGRPGVTIDFDVDDQRIRLNIQLNS